MGSWSKLRLFFADNLRVFISDVFLVEKKKIIMRMSAEKEISRINSYNITQLYFENLNFNFSEINR